MNPLSLYIHIPFCVKKCNYCDFLSFKSDDESIEKYLNALQKEINSYQKLAKNYLVNTIFIGGGTPSIIDEEDMASLFQTVKQIFQIDKRAEITIEVNPGTVTKDKLLNYRTNGINRLSIGLQSTKEELLKDLGRIHSYSKFLETYTMARNVGFDNINIDLIFGLPKQTIIDWNDTLDEVISIQPEHISCYSLIVEENTMYYKEFEEGNLILPSEETEREMYYNAVDILEKAGYYQYEISNFAKNNYICKHNLVYWIGKEYLGIGLGASSYIDKYRFKNADMIENYCENSHDYNLIRKDINYINIERQIEEYMFLGLRLTKGISKNEFQQKFDKSIEEIFEKELKKLETEGLINNTEDNIRLTKKGIDLSNYVFQHFLLD